MHRPFDLLDLFRKPKPGSRPGGSVRPASGPLTEAQGAALRGAEREQDRTLSNVAQRWLAALPPRMRPAELCARYPRIANRLALCWNDALLAERLFDQLMLNKRAWRQGFPPEIAAELMRLRDWSAHQRRIEEKVDFWRMQATADR